MDGMYPHYGSSQFKAQFFHTICQSPITENKAYELSKNEDSHKAAASFKAGEDMRSCGDRHGSCHTELRDHCKDDNLHPNRLKVGVLTVCRQVYVETNSALLSTNTWSFHDKCSWHCWLSKMNASQKQLIKKVHLCLDVVFDFMAKHRISTLKGLEELNVDIFTLNCRPQRINQFFRAERITFIANDCWKTSNDHCLIEPATFKERVAIGEDFRAHVITVQNDAAPKTKSGDEDPFEEREK